MKINKVIIMALVLMLFHTEAFAATHTVIQTGESKNINLNSVNIPTGQLSTTVYGSTYANVLGNDGDCEVTGKFTTSSSALALDTSTKAIGNSSIKITNSVTGQGRLIKDATGIASRTDGKFWFVSAYMKNGNATGMVLQMTDNVSYSVSSSTITDTSSFTRVGLKYNDSSIAAASTLRSLIVAVNGSSTQYGYVDGIMLVQISSTEFTNLSVQQLLDKYPYINCTKSTLGTNIKATVSSPYSESVLSLPAAGLGMSRANGSTWAELSSKQTWVWRGSGQGFMTVEAGISNPDGLKTEYRRNDGMTMEYVNPLTQLSDANQYKFNPAYNSNLTVSLDNSDTGFTGTWTGATTFTGMTWDGLTDAYMNGWKLITPDTVAANCVWMGIKSGTTQAGAAAYAIVTTTRDTGFQYNKLIRGYDGVALAGTYTNDSAGYSQDTAKQQNDYIEYYKNDKVVVNFNWYHNPGNWTEDYLTVNNSGVVTFDESYPGEGSSTASVEALDDNNNFLGTANATLAADGKSVTIAAVGGATKYNIRYQLKDKTSGTITKLTGDGTGLGIETLSTANTVVKVSGSNITITLTLKNPADASETIKLYTDSTEVISGTLSGSNKTAVFTTTTAAYPSMTNSTYFTGKRWTCKYSKAKTGEIYKNIVSDGLVYTPGSNTISVENTSYLGCPNAAAVINTPDAPAAVAQTGLQQDTSFNRAGQVKIKWTPVTGAERYRIYRKEAQNDSSIESGGLNTATGQPAVNAAKLRSQKFTRIKRNTGYALINDKGYTSANIMYYDSAYQFISYETVSISSFKTPDLSNIRYAKFEVTGTDLTASMGLFETSDNAYRSIASTTNSYYIDNALKVTAYIYKVVPIKGKTEAALAAAPQVTVHKAGLAKPTVNVSPGTYNRTIYVEIKGYSGKTIEYQINGGTWKDYTGKIKVAVNTTLNTRIKGEPSTQTSYVYNITNYTLPASFTLSTTTWDNTAGEVTITWAAVTGAVKYDVYRSTAENGTFTRLNTAYLTGTAFADSTVQPGKNRKYYYKVKAYNSMGRSVMSAARVCVVP